MSSDAERVRRHLATLQDDARSAAIPSDVLGRLLVQEAIEIWKRERPWQDIARELVFIAEHLDPDTDYEFMRP
jgi:hypothetical protein